MYSRFWMVLSVKKRAPISLWPPAIQSKTRSWAPVAMPNPPPPHPVHVVDGCGCGIPQWISTKTQQSSASSGEVSWDSPWHFFKRDQGHQNGSTWTWSMTSKLGWKTNPSSPRDIYISYILYLYHDIHYQQFKTAMHIQCFRRPNLQGQGVVGQSFTDAFEQWRMCHLKMPICPAHLSKSDKWYQMIMAAHVIFQKDLSIRDCTTESWA